MCLKLNVAVLKNSAFQYQNGNNIKMEDVE